MTDQFDEDKKQENPALSEAAVSAAFAEDSAFATATADKAAADAAFAEASASATATADKSAPKDPRAGAAQTATETPLEALRREKDALQDRLLRTAAEFDNYRKRVDRDRRDRAEAALADALEDLLPIMDNLERALQAPAGDAVDAYRKGVELIHQQMTDLLKKRGVKPVEALGADFDPRYHQAVVQEVSPGHREGEVMEELRRGYLLGDRLLRPAMVKVARRG